MWRLILEIMTQRCLWLLGKFTFVCLWRIVSKKDQRFPEVLMGTGISPDRQELLGSPVMFRPSGDDSQSAGRFYKSAAFTCSGGRVSSGSRHHQAALLWFVQSFVSFGLCFLGKRHTNKQSKCSFCKAATNRGPSSAQCFALCSIKNPIAFHPRKSTKCHTLLHLCGPF